MIIPLTFINTTKLLKKNESTITNLRRRLKKRNQKLKQQKKSARKWRKRALKLKKQLLTVSKQSKQKRTEVSSFIAELIKNDKRNKGARYSNKLKNIALSLYYCSNKAYRQLRQHIKLPSVSLLKKWMKCVDIKDGISENVISLLKSKAKLMPKPSRLVTICLDEMTLKEGITYLANAKPDEVVGFPSIIPDQKKIDTSKRAKSVLVFMIKGINGDFKQALGYYFSKNGFSAKQLEVLLKHVIGVVQETGFVPKLIFSDQNATNRSLFNKLGISSKKPYFEHKEMRIYGMYDSPHLIKSSRNNLYHNNAVYRGKLIKWDHLRKLYHEDIKRIPRAAPKIKRKHVYIPPFGEMKVGLATQTLSSTTAAAIKSYVKLKVLPKECLNTADYCTDFDKLFDIFNASSVLNKKELRRPVSSNSAHWKFLTVMEKRLKKLEFLTKECNSLAERTTYKELPKQSRHPYFVDGWLLNISCLKLLCKDLETNYNITELATQKLSQDCLENLFSQIRMKGFNNRHPTPYAFRASYRQVVMMQLLSPSIESNCEMDKADSILTAEDFSRVKIFNQSVTRSQTSCLDSEICDANGELFDPAEITNVHYTAGWLLSCIEHDQCHENLQADKKVSCSVSTLSSMKKETKREKAGIKLTSLLETVVVYFKENFLTFLETSTYGVKERMVHGLLSLKIIPHVLCNDCSEKVIGKYFNMLIKAKLNEMNQAFSEAPKSKNDSVAQKAQKLNITSK